MSNNTTQAENTEKPLEPYAQLIALLCNEVTDTGKNAELRSRVANIFDEHCVNEAIKEEEPTRPSPGMR